jgi:hypothetical protein
VAPELESAPAETSDQAVLDAAPVALAEANEEATADVAPETADE